jgi:hypothetical protein
MDEEGIVGRLHAVPGGEVVKNPSNFQPRLVQWRHTHIVIIGQKSENSPGIEWFRNRGANHFCFGGGIGC